jgi:hypothetical protein
MRVDISYEGRSACLDARVRSVIGPRLDMVAEKKQTPIFTVLTLLGWA